MRSKTRVKRKRVQSFWRAPDPDKHPLNYHRWWSKHIMWPAAPETFNEFWKKGDSCKQFHDWFRDRSVRFWFHSLMQHLIEMWEDSRGILKATPIRTGRRGRPRIKENIELQLCVLDSIIHGLLGPNDPDGRKSPRHWLEAVALLK